LVVRLIDAEPPGSIVLIVAIQSQPRTQLGSSAEKPAFAGGTNQSGGTLPRLPGLKSRFSGYDSQLRQQRFSRTQIEKLSIVGNFCQY
jgi:hypothetical protein